MLRDKHTHIVKHCKSMVVVLLAIPVWEHASIHATFHAVTLNADIYIDKFGSQPSYHWKTLFNQFELGIVSAQLGGNPQTNNANHSNTLLFLGCHVQKKRPPSLFKRASRGGKDLQRRGGPPAGMEEAESAYSTRQKKPPSPRATHRTETSTTPEREKTQRTPFGRGKVTLKSSTTSMGTSQ
ncbi:hypothetical protein K450DRAFT_248340 [Umbelopsis ramanniana AG]|uniref:Uncharacterized protein n=1 Tax=Umbelopsis ramanniana AG TaxID=1314678 RepID=A0AAD5HDG1_UMBRA|nr:uncharacterized protein K450DRAFT_248340 [Umbelopsis ramanniana AG]KAI8578148.1 hypothetical protein K450DRAFT_248340 [Umbelopsis ramanniana AG]